MIESFYNAFGFIGALAISFILFIFFIFWIAGLAGICLKKEDNNKKTFRIVVAVLIPLYPFLWMIYDMIIQRKYMEKA